MPAGPAGKLLLLGCSSGPGGKTKLARPLTETGAPTTSPAAADASYPPNSEPGRPRLPRGLNRSMGDPGAEGPLETPPGTGPLTPTDPTAELAANASAVAAADWRPALVPLGRCLPALWATAPAAGGSGDAGAAAIPPPTTRELLPTKAPVVAAPTDNGLPEAPLCLAESAPPALRAGKDPRAELATAPRELPCGSRNKDAAGAAAPPTPPKLSSSLFGTADRATGRTRPVRCPSMEKLIPVGAFSTRGEGLAAETPSKGIGRAAVEAKTEFASAVGIAEPRGLCAILSNYFRAFKAQTVKK